MDYEKHYYALTNRASTRIIDGYTEKHHIKPKCLGGTDDGSNLVRLTPEEHYLAHQLLVKIYPSNRKLLFAARMMTVSAIGQRTKNKMYGWLKRKISEVGHSTDTREKIGKSHKGSKRSDEIKTKMSILQKERGGYGPKIFSDDHKKKLSESNKGKHSGPKSNEHRNNISNALRGREKTKGFTGKTHSDISKNRASETQKAKNLQPWETGAVLKSQKCIDLWKQLDIVYDFWVKFSDCGHRKICTAMKISIEPSIENMVKWIRLNGDPKTNTKWLEFKQGK